MPLFIKESLVYRLVIAVCKAFATAYGESKFKKYIADNVALMWKNSATHKILSAYVNKEPYFESSLFYRLFMFIFSLFDKLFALLNTLIFGLLSGSAIWREVQDCKRLTVRGVLFYLGVLVMAVAVGGVLGAIIFANKSSLNLVLCWVIFGLGAVLVLASVFWQKITESGIYRLIKWIFE
jgi:hypothetical protein